MLTAVVDRKLKFAVNSLARNCILSNDQYAISCNTDD